MKGGTILVQAIVRSASFVLMVGLAVWVLYTAARIEIANAAAGNYLPGPYSKSEMDGMQGKWRIVPALPERNHLRHLVETDGILQYPFSIIVILLAVFHLVWPRPIYRVVAAFSGLAGLLALGLAINRAYFPSLGW